MSVRRIILLLLAVVIVGSVVSTGGLSQKRQSTNPEPRKMVTVIPPTYSIVESLEIVSTKLINEGSPGVGVEVEIRNNSHKAVMAVDLVSGEGAVTTNGLTDAENPIVVIEPFGTTTMQMAFGAMTYGAPLVISAVTYADGSEAGDEKSLRIMHKIRERDRLKIKAQRDKLVNP